MTGKRLSLALLAAVLAGWGCDEPRQPRAADTSATEPWTDAWLMQQGIRYLDDANHRRASMVASLRNPQNLYSRTRIASYGLGDRGWDRLPEWNPISRPLNRADRRTLADGGAPALTDTRPLFDGSQPTSASAWVALGRDVFFHYPLRADAFVRFGLGHPDVAQDVGLLETAGGETPGVVVFRDVDGSTQVGITCALCHTTVDGGAVIEGRARRSFDYGRLQLREAEARGRALDPEMAERMASWGPGRADITEDDSEDPVAIPDLWGLRHQTALTQAGTIRHIGPTALALRQETQYLYANHHRTRPPRTLVWALTMYLYALTPPSEARRGPPDERGAEIFDEHCGDCHSNPALGGRPVRAVRVGTDSRLSEGVARGTGLYRPSALIQVANAGPYLHHGAVATLDDLLSPARLEDDYQGPLGRGVVPGHRWGLHLPSDQKEALLRYLEML